MARGYPHNLIEKVLSDIKFTERVLAIKQQNKTHKEILPFVTLCEPSLLMEKWHMIQNQPLLRDIFKDPPMISVKKGQSLKSMLARAKIYTNAESSMNIKY